MNREDPYSRIRPIINKIEDHYMIYHYSLEDMIVSLEELKLYCEKSILDLKRDIEEYQK